MKLEVSKVDGGIVPARDGLFLIKQTTKRSVNSKDAKQRRSK